ncbi:hypothetical protein QQ045_025126 [Rhodiola kirilowii]
MAASLSVSGFYPRRRIPPAAAKLTPRSLTSINFDPDTRLSLPVEKSQDIGKWGFAIRASSLKAGMSAAEKEEDAAEVGYGKIAFSDVVVKRKPREFWGRKIGLADAATLVVIAGMHLMCLAAPFCFTWSAFWVAAFLYVVTGLFGITLSFHRQLSHKSFTLPKWLEYTFAYFGSLALQGSPVDWVSTHRFHHQFCDSERDPHSPTEGFWFSHMNWLFDKGSVLDKCGEASNVGDLKRQRFYRFMQKTYVIHPIMLGVALYAIGGWPFVVWGMGVRTVWVYHITWLVNSACHVWGNQSWNTGDLSRNCWWVALLSFGEGWHNNHHAFEYSARHGLEPWQVDMTWGVVKLLEMVGLATNVKLPSDAHKKRMVFQSGGSA